MRDARFRSGQSGIFIIMQSGALTPRESRMEKKNLDWANIGFGYVRTENRFVAEYHNGEWGEGRLTDNAEVTISESACVLQYAQTAFEGLKAYETADGRIVCFRPDLNAARMADSCRRMMMPVYSEEKFLDAVDRVVAANAAYVPPYGTGASLYLRPFMFGTTPVVGVKPANDFEFRIFVTPVGPYFKGGAKPLRLRVSDYDRAAPHGTGHIKAGLNYAMSLYQTVDAHEQGFDENLYLDPMSRTFIEETGGANIIFISRDGKLVTPKSDSILPSITRRSLLYIAANILGMEVEERPVAFDEVKDFVECGLCGTAAVISPVGMISDHGKEIYLPSGMEQMGPATKKLYDTFRGIQLGTAPAPEGWLREIRL